MNKIIYHGDCTDGFGAAYAAWKALGDTAEYIPKMHGQAPPQVSNQDDLFILDFSFPREVMLELQAQARSVTLLDHHRSAADALGDLAGCHFDMGQSGALLAWRHFHPNTPVPNALLRIDDWDRWQFKLPHTLEQHAGFDLYKMDFKVWDELIHKRMPEVLAEGRIVLRHNEVIVNRVCNNSCEIRLSDRAGVVHRGVATNSAELKSEVGHELLRRHPEADFAAVYNIDWDSKERQHVVRWSLRSRHDQYDVLPIAQAAGGGGHPDAAAFREPMHIFFSRFSDRFESVNAPSVLSS